MDPAVALVQAYLQFNGYLCVTEYPVVEAVHPGAVRTATDLDVLAVRFPGAGRLIAANYGDASDDRVICEPDRDLGVRACDRAGIIDFIIGEVKEGEARLNRGATDPDVLRAALVRFGAFEEPDASWIVSKLRRRGEALTRSGKRVRLMVFAGHIDERDRPRNATVITLGHMAGYIERLQQRHRAVFAAARFKDPAMGIMQMLDKARRNEDR